LFGPLFDGAIVDFAALAGLVRETAINAGNMIRTLRTNYCTLYPCTFKASLFLLSSMLVIAVAWVG